MDRIKNLRAGIVIIADAKLKLAPGQCVPVETLTPQMQSAIDAGLLARVGGATEAKAEGKADPKADGNSKPRGGRGGAKATAKTESEVAAPAESEPEVAPESPTVDTPAADSVLDAASVPQLELSPAGESDAGQ